MDDENQINGGESLGDDFYEKIEAPKFVDLAKSDHNRPDDRYWFCVRIGCDQKHEEEMDSEAIYKNFVLRVMAARSPNVHLKKALYRKDLSKNAKCPLTVPTKSSKSRLSRLALVSSISQKMVGGKVKGRPLFKQCETPKKKEKQSYVATKAFTPQIKKGLSNLGTFRSVTNPKPTALAAPKNRTVAKALVFHSPKKTVRMNLKKSTELSASMRKLCLGMKKLEITSGKKHISDCNKSFLVDTSRKRFRGREIKSRVYDSLHPRNCPDKETKTSKCSKKKNEQKEFQLHCGPAPCDRTENDSSDMDIEEKPRYGSLEVCSTSGISKNNEGNRHEECLETQKTWEFPSSENKCEAISDASGSDLTSIIHSKERNTGDNGVDQQVKSRQEKRIEPDDVMETDEKENVSVSDDKENKNGVVNHNQKENASAANDHRKLNSNTSHMETKKILGKQETSKGRQKITRGTTKTSKGNSTATVNCAEGVNYGKPKLTNPKPFRLRTDERQILKEANLEKKLRLVEPLQERTTKRIYQTAFLRNEKCLGQIECASCAHESSEKEPIRSTQKDHPRRRGTSCSQTSKAAAEQKESTTPQRNTVSVLQKTRLAASRHEFIQDKAAKKSKESFKKTKSSLCMKQVARTRGIEQPSERKTISLATPDRLSIIKESSPKIVRAKVVGKRMKNVTSPASKASASSMPRPSLLGRKPTTTPKEKHFNNVHEPKNCTRGAV